MAKQAALQETAPQETDGDDEAHASSNPYATVMMGLAVIGVVVGIANVYLMVRRPAEQRLQQQPARRGGASVDDAGGRRLSTVSVAPLPVATTHVVIRGME